MTLLRAPARALVTAAACLLVAGCGQPGSGAVADDQPSVLGPPPGSSPSPSPSDYQAPIKTMGSGGLQDATPEPPLTVPAFGRAMAAYCSDYYTTQREAEEKYLGSAPQIRVTFARANAANTHRTERQLERMTPPAKLASTFGEFVENARRISDDRQSMLRSTQATGEDGRAGADLDDVLEERWAVATRLRAPLWGGKRPPPRGRTPRCATASPPRRKRPPSSPSPARGPRRPTRSAPAANSSRRGSSRTRPRVCTFGRWRTPRRTRSPTTSRWCRWRAWRTCPRPSTTSRSAGAGAPRTATCGCSSSTAPGW